MGMVEISGYYGNLQKGFKEIGLKVDFYPLNSHIFQYDYKKPNNIYYYFVKFLIDKNNHCWRRLKIGNSIHEKYFKRLYDRLYDRFFKSCINRYDVFIFSYSTSFYPDYRDLEILKANGKMVIHFFHGSDSRPPYMNGAIMSRENGLTIDNCYELTKEMVAKIAKIETYADYIISGPGSGQFFSKPYINSFNIGIPFDMEPLNRLDIPKQGPIKILHSPSNPEAKGTLEIQRVINKLKSEGFELELEIIEGKPNKVVLETIKNSHLIIDQIYTDTPVAGFAVESIANGTPVIVCGYFSQWYNENTQGRNLPPALFVHPDDFEKTLKQMLEFPDEYYKILDQTRDYLKIQWSRKAVASKFQKLFDNTPHEKWIIQPNDVDYIEGLGMSRPRLKDVMVQIREKYGDQGFMLDKNRTKKIIDLISSRP